MNRWKAVAVLLSATSIFWLMLSLGVITYGLAHDVTAWPITWFILFVAPSSFALYLSYRCLKKSRSIVKKKMELSIHPLSRTPSAPAATRPPVATSPAPPVEHVVTRQCPKCWEEVGEDERFCHSCGAKLVEAPPAIPQACPSCGAELKEGAIFCHKCSKVVHGKLDLTVPTIPAVKVGYRIHTIDYSKEDKPLEMVFLMKKGVTHDEVILSDKGEIHVSTLELVGSPTTSMRFRIDDGDIVQMRLTATGGVASLDTTELSNGEHTLTVLAVDSRDNQAQKSVKVIVKNRRRLAKWIIGLACLLPGLFLIWTGGIFFSLVYAYLSGSSPNIIYLVICGLPLIFGVPLAFWKSTRQLAEFLIGFWMVGIIYVVIKMIGG